MKASTAAAFLTSKWRVLQQSRRRQYGYAFVERWEKATLVHGFLMESKPGETVLAALALRAEPADQTHQEVRLGDEPIA